MKAQKDPFAFYKQLFACADSIKTPAQNGIVSKEISKIADTLDQQHPVNYFEECGKLLARYKFNDAAFIYYLGYFRYRFYNLTNPDYQASEDGALFGSFAATLGEPINIFLRTDIDNFIGILNLSKEWLTNHDYIYFSKARNLIKYEQQIDQLEHLIKDLVNNKQKYETQWSEELSRYRKLYLTKSKEPPANQKKKD